MKSIILTDEKWTAVLSPDFGMNPISLRYDNKPVLREPPCEAELSDSPVLYGMPVLLPANRTQNARFVFDGKTYTLPMNEPEHFNNLHGCLYTAHFTVTEQNSSSVRSVLKNDGEYYPFPFTLSFYDSVSKNGYRREVTLLNGGDTAMPFTLAFHTTFVEPDTFAVPVEKRYEWDGNYIFTGRMLPLNETEKTFETSCSPRGKEISAAYSSKGPVARIGKWRFAVSDNFDLWVFYNGNGNDGYLCVEPQCGEVNGLNRPGGHRCLAPGERARFYLEIGSVDDL